MQKIIIIIKTNADRPSDIPQPGYSTLCCGGRKKKEVLFLRVGNFWQNIPQKMLGGSRRVLLRSFQTGRQFSTQKFWDWTVQPRPNWMKDKKEGIVACVIFGITGTTSALLVRPAVEKVLGIKGSLVEGPNSYRIASILFISPVYALLLGITGTLAGRHTFFAKMSFKILGRFFPKRILSGALCEPAKAKQFVQK